MIVRSAVAATLLSVAILAATALPAAGQGEFVRLSVSIAPVVASGVPVPLSVAVDADRGALSTRSDHLRLRVRYAPECAGTFDGTPGPVAIDTRVPDPGAANSPYHATSNGAASVSALGVYSVCAYLEEEGTKRLFAQDSDTQFRATAACTSASRNDASAAAALRAARDKLAHAHGRRRAALRRKVTRLVAQQQATANSLQSACAA